MATIKSYTNLEQSKKLAKILPIESADMGYIPSAEDDDGNTLYTAEFRSEFIFDEDYCIPCWSLAALLEYMNRNFYNISLNYCGSEYTISFDDSENYKTITKDYSIDAVFEMVIWLKENNRL